MALLVPIAPGKFTIGQKWGPSFVAVEPAGYGYLGRFWWNPLPLPFRYYKHFHPGLDLIAAEGTPILAGETGIFTAVGWNGASGLRVNISIRPGTLYVHGHLSRIGTNPRTGALWAVGAKILRGETCGYVGHSGSATGNHDHYGVLSIVPGTKQHMIYDPGLFSPPGTLGTGANANDPRIQPYY